MLHLAEALADLVQLFVDGLTHAQQVLNQLDIVFEVCSSRITDLGRLHLIWLLLFHSTRHCS